MKSAAAKFYEITVSGTQKYAVAQSFLEDMAALKRKFIQNSDDLRSPSRLALRKHPFHLSLPPLSIPEALDKAAIDYLRNNCLYSIKHLNQMSKKLFNFLHERPFLKEQDIIERTNRIAKHKLKSIDSTDSDIGLQSSDVIDELLQYQKDNSFSGASRESRQLKESLVSEWSSVTYSKNTCQLYLVARLVPNFATACRVLYEIRKRCPLFTPRSLFDFASGLGTYAWAANTVWPAGCITEHHLIEGSIHMNSIAEFLLKKDTIGSASPESAFTGVHHRRFLPSANVNSDLVMCGNVLLELAGEKERMRVIENLWQRTTGFLVLIEEGTKAGFSAILEARDWLIKRGGEEMKIFAPCPHRGACGKANLTCSSGVRYYQLGLTQDVSYPSVEHFSYLIVCRGDWRRFQTIPSESLPRVVSDVPSDGGSFLDVDLCLPNGACERVTFAKSASDKDFYFLLKNSHSGDIAPCERLKEDDLAKNVEPSITEQI